MAQAIRVSNIEARQARRSNRGEVRKQVINIICGIGIMAALLSLFYIAPMFDDIGSNKAQIQARK